MDIAIVKAFDPKSWDVFFYPEEEMVKVRYSNSYLIILNSMSK